MILNYSGKNLQSLDTFLSQLQTQTQNQNIKSLNLTNNNLTKLFSNPQSQYFHKLFTLEVLDLCENPIEDVPYTIQEICSAFPNLKDLRLNLYDEDHVDLILKLMPGLTYLNSLPVERDEYSQDEHGKSTDTKPSDVDYQEIDENYQFTPTSQPPKIYQQDQQCFNLNLSQVNAQNSHPKDSRQTTTRDQQDNITLNPADLEQVALIYDKIRGMHRQHQPQNDKRLATEFDNHLKNVMINLSQVLKEQDGENCNIDQRVKDCEVLKSKFMLFDVCFDKAIQFLQYDGKQQEHDLFNQLRTDIKSLFYTLATVKIQKEEKQPQNNLQSQFDSLQQDHLQLQKSHFQLNSDFKKLEEYNQELQEKLQQFQNQQALEREHFKQERQEMMEQIQELEKENKTCIDTLIKHSKNSTSNLTKQLTPNQISSQAQSNLNTQREINLNSMKVLLNCESGNISQGINIGTVSPLALNKNMLNQ
eukprot:403342166